MLELKDPPRVMGDAAVRQMRGLTRRSLLVGAVATLAGLGSWHWLTTASEEDGVPWPLRRVLRFNEGVAEGLGSPQHLAPTFPPESVQGPARTNGLIGLSAAVEGARWRLRVEYEGRGPGQTFRLRDIQELPRVDLVTELKCVEGWSAVMHFGGVRFSDFVARFGLATRSGRAADPEGNPHDLYHYVYLATPDEDYYVRLDLASALHPQTLLCDTMNGQLLTREHGAPLRLYLAVKYGYKSLKRIGLIRFQDERPPDYWAARGYDWYAGL
ncbi:MAG TPA: molybdopterin-dependent oxidoreductase [Gemmataceae bacterium]|nr:molybdopterin-dependent oxidoreductase [Gemmataceae bacterium]